MFFCRIFRCFLWCLSAAFFFTALTGRSIEVGQSSEVVLQQLGEPQGRMGLKGKIRWFYEQGSVLFRDDQVESWTLLSGAEQETNEAKRRKLLEQQRRNTPETTPAIEAGFAVRPVFMTQGILLEAGAAFFVTANDRATPFLMTAEHVVKPAKTKLPVDVEMSSEIALLKNIVDGNDFAVAIAHVPVSDGLDLTVFKTDYSEEVHPRALASENAKKGDVVWLVSRIRNRPSNKILHRGIILGAWKSGVICKFDDGKLLTSGASGSPYVNARGEVVGLHTSHSDTVRGVVGSMIPAETIQREINLEGR